jgi:hypothetical protein
VPDYSTRVELAQALAVLGDFAWAVALLAEQVRQWPVDQIARRDQAIFAERGGEWQALLALDDTDDEAKLRLCAVCAELPGITPTELDRLRSDHPHLAHAIEGRRSCGRDCLRL